MEQNNVETNSVELNSLVFESFDVFNPTGVLSNISRGQLKDIIRHPMTHNKTLRQISIEAYNINGIYANTIDYMVSIPTLSYVISAHSNASEKIKTKREMFNVLMERIKHKETTRDILMSLFVEGMYVGFLRDTAKQKAKTKKSFRDDFDSNIRRIEGLTLDDNFQIFPLPLDYCRIRGVVNGVNVADFNLEYFDQFVGNGLSGEITNFPEDFVVAYAKYKKDATKKWHTLDYRTTVAIKCKSRKDEPYGRPLGISAFVDMQENEKYNDNQSAIIDELASSIYIMTLPESVDQSKECGLNNKQQEAQREAFKGCVRNNTKGGSKISTLVVAPRTKIERLTKDASLLKDTLYEENQKKISTALGFAGSALNASGEGGASYSSLSVNIDLVSSQVFQYIDLIAEEYTKILNYHMGIKKIKDFIKIEYLPISWLNKDSNYNKYKEIYTLAGGNRSYMIASTGANVDSYYSTTLQEQEDGWEEIFVPHQTSYTMNNDTNSDKNGRPEKDEGELTTSGQITKNLGSNNQIKPSTNK